MDLFEALEKPIKYIFKVYEPDKSSESGRKNICNIHYTKTGDIEDFELEMLVDTFEEMPPLLWFASTLPKTPDNDPVKNLLESFIKQRVPPPNRMFLLETFEDDGITDVNDWIGMMKANGGRAFGDDYTVDVIDLNE